MIVIFSVTSSTMCLYVLSFFLVKNGFYDEKVVRSMKFSMPLIQIILLTASACSTVMNLLIAYTIIRNRKNDAILRGSFFSLMIVQVIL